MAVDAAWGYSAFPIQQYLSVPILPRTAEGMGHHACRMTETSLLSSQPKQSKLGSLWNQTAWPAAADVVGLFLIWTFHLHSQALGRRKRDWLNLIALMAAKKQKPWLQ